MIGGLAAVIVIMFWHLHTDVELNCLFWDGAETVKKHFIEDSIRRKIWVSTVHNFTALHLTHRDRIHIEDICWVYDDACSFKAEENEAGNEQMNEMKQMNNATGCIMQILFLPSGPWLWRRKQEVLLPEILAHFWCITPSCRSVHTSVFV